MSDREMLLLIYGALKVASEKVSSLRPVLQMLEQHLEKKSK